VLLFYCFNYNIYSGGFTERETNTFCFELSDTRMKNLDQRGIEEIHKPFPFPLIIDGFFLV
jgi:hypothetical protein